MSTRGWAAAPAIPKLDGGIQRYVDLFTESPSRCAMITIDSVSFSSLIPGMEAGRYDFIAAPTTVTKERAEKMLFTAGLYLDGLSVRIEKGSAPIKGWEDLKGKAVAVCPRPSVSSHTTIYARQRRPTKQPRRPCGSVAAAIPCSL
jgi:polar amino acid transport system substrate-binding protein